MPSPGIVDEVDVDPYPVVEVRRVATLDEEAPSIGGNVIPRRIDGLEPPLTGVRSMIPSAVEVRLDPGMSRSVPVPR